MSLATLYMTAPDKSTAKKIARELVEQRLVACANVLDDVTSFFWWEGKVQEEGEAVMFAKTSMRLVNEAVEKIKEMHPDDVPCACALPILKTNKDYMEFVLNETKDPEPAVDWELDEEEEEEEEGPES
jgi:periplasmic divalent cation tolerance protein